MTQKRDAAYWRRVRAHARALKSDGCTGVPEFYRDCCLEHDVAYRTGRDIDGNTRTRAEADRRFRECMQERSPLSRWSPVSWWRWAAVRLFAAKNWKGE